MVDGGVRVIPQIWGQGQCEVGSRCIWLGWQLPVAPRDLGQSTLLVTSWGSSMFSPSPVAPSVTTRFFRCCLV
jgi:hypothetical protein